MCIAAGGEQSPGCENEGLRPMTWLHDVQEYPGRHTASSVPSDLKSESGGWRGVRERKIRGCRSAVSLSYVGTATVSIPYPSSRSNPGVTNQDDRPKTTAARPCRCTDALPCADSGRMGDANTGAMRCPRPRAIITDGNVGRRWVRLPYRDMLFLMADGRRREEMERRRETAWERGAHVAASRWWRRSRIQKTGSGGAGCQMWIRIRVTWCTALSGKGQGVSSMAETRARTMEMKTRWNTRE